MTALESESSLSLGPLYKVVLISVKTGTDPVQRTFCFYCFVNFITLNDGRSPRSEYLKCDTPFIESTENKFCVLCRLYGSGITAT